MKGALYVLRVNEAPHQKINSWRANADVEAVIVSKRFIKTSGEVLLNIRGSHIPMYGDYLIVYVQPEEILPPQNPSQFNYKRFLSFQNIYCRFNLKPGNFFVTSQRETNCLYKTSYTLRDNLVLKLKQYFKSKDELAVASALLVGFEDYLDPEIIQAFSSTGALHVLSVSGMHVGLVFVFLSRFLFFLDKKKTTLVLKHVILLSFIWFYALLTGFSPSVLRSVVMVSLVIISKMWKRDSNTLNTMLASAFLLLCVNPFYLTEVGFQLSYLAVFGIVYLHPMFSQLYVAPNRFIHWIWELTSVSLCAQLMTFPLGLLYFHQFPLLFLVSNLIVIPVSTGIIYAGIASLLIFFIEPIANFLWLIAYYLTYFLNAVVRYIDSLKSLTLNGLSITIFETWLTYFLIASVLGFLIYRKRKLLTASLGLAILLAVLQVREKHLQLRQRSLIVYNIPRKTALNFIDGNEHVFIADSGLLSNANQIRFFVLHNWDDLGLNTPHKIKSGEFNSSGFSAGDIFKHKSFVFFGGKRIFIAGDWIPQGESSQKIKTDVIIITQAYKGKLKTLLKCIQAKEIIFDSSVPLFKLNIYRHEIADPSIHTKSASETGAVILNF